MQFFDLPIVNNKFDTRNHALNDEHLNKHTALKRKIILKKTSL